MESVNFIEAINGGEKFRPVNWSESVDGGGWYSWFNDELWFSDSNGNKAVPLTRDIINWSFNIIEKEITITKGKFHEIWQKVNGCTYRNSDEAKLYRDLKSEFFK